MNREFLTSAEQVVVTATLVDTDNVTWTTSAVKTLPVKVILVGPRKKVAKLSAKA